MRTTEGPVLVITGASRGIGREAARQAARRGFRLALFARRESELGSLADELGDDVLHVAGDLGRLGDVERFADAVQSRFGDVHRVFSSAGFAPFGPLAALDEPAVTEALRTLVAGPLYLLRAFVPHLASDCSVLLTANGMHHRPLTESALWVGATHAVVGLTRALAVELAPRGIRVNALSHGPVDTPIFDDYGMPPDQVAAMKAQLASQTLAKRMASPAEIAAFALSLLEEGSYVTGTEIVANGGWDLGA